MSRVMVTGGAGFIGSHLVDRLLDAGHKVYVIDDLSGGSQENLTDYHGLYIEDCRDFHMVDRTFKEVQPEIVFHLAANAAEHKAIFSPVDVVTRNYDSFLSVLTAGLRHGMKRIVTTSSIATYGSIKPPFKENDRCQPEDLYGLAKLHMDETLKIMARVHDFTYVSLRPHNVYGPRQNMRDPYRNVLGIFFNHILQNKPYVIYGDGTMQRSYSYVADVVDVMYQAAFSDKINNEVLNVGSDHPATLNELSDAVQAVTKTKLAPQYLPARAHEVHTAVEDHSRCQELFGYRDTPLHEGIAATWAWAKKQGYQKPIYGDIEIDSPLIPKNWRR